MENDSNGSSGSSCNSSNSSGSCNESTITSSSCGSGNNFNLSHKPGGATTANSNNMSISNYRKRKLYKMKACKIQRYGRRPRLSLPNIWLNLEELKTESRIDEGEEAKENPQKR